MAEPLSVRSRSARAGEESTARRQTGALHAAGLDYEGLLPEGGRQDHAGQQLDICNNERYELAYWHLCKRSALAGHR